MAIYTKDIVHVEITGASLLFSYLGEESPKIWCGNISQMTTANFYIQPEKNKYQLLVRINNEKIEEILSFGTKQDAQKALTAIHEVLHGYAGSRAQKGAFKKSIKYFLIFLVIFTIWSLWNAPKTQKTALPVKEITSDIKKGYPLSAEDILEK